MQLMQHVRLTGRKVRVVHPIDLLDAAYGGKEAVEAVVMEWGGHDGTLAGHFKM